jgi:hypothetical protein
MLVVAVVLVLVLAFSYSLCWFSACAAKIIDIGNRGKFLEVDTENPPSQYFPGLNVLCGEQTGPIRSGSPIDLDLPTLFFQREPVLESDPVVPIEACREGIFHAR